MHAHVLLPNKIYHLRIPIHGVNACMYYRMSGQLNLEMDARLSRLNLCQRRIFTPEEVAELYSAVASPSSEVLDKIISMLLRCWV